MKLIIDDELQALLLLSSLLNNWETLLNVELQLAIVKNSLLNEKARRNDMGKDNAQALVIIEGEVRVEILEGCGKSRSRSELKGKFKCFYSDKEGHIKRN